MRDALLELKEEVFEALNVLSIDDHIAQVLAALGEDLRRIGYGLSDDQTGVVRHRSYTDWDGAGVVKGVIIDGEELQAKAQLIWDLAHASKVS